ncbi:MAG TPA: hypothetical protein VEZ46_06950 [Mycobacteriales bacterium]|jgi:hypothetical protein|nr:hypothetical protein [Mycobacteriales bacterium]
MAPGERLRIYVRSGTGSRLTKYWGRTAKILNDSGDVVRVKSYRNVTIDCFAWGTGRC